MKRLLLSSIIFLCFSFSVLIFQISCSKIVDAQSKQPGQTVSSFAKVKGDTPPYSLAPSHTPVYSIEAVSGGYLTKMDAESQYSFDLAINSSQSIFFSTESDAFAFLKNTMIPINPEGVYRVVSFYAPASWPNVLATQL